VSNVLQHLAGPLAVLRGGLSRLRGRRLRASRLYLEVTHRCNLRCIACYTTAGAEKPDALYGDLFPLVDYILNLGMRVVMFTNGTVVDAEVARSLIARDVVVYFQLPSLRPEVLDRVTGRKGTHVWVDYPCRSGQAGSTARIPAGLKHLLDEQAAQGKDGLVRLETLITRVNHESIPDVARFAGALSLGLHLETPVFKGRAIDNYREIALGVSEYRRLYEALREILGREFMEAHRTHRCVVERNPVVWTNGDVAFCSSRGGGRVGNVRDAPLRELFARARRLKRREDRRLAGRCRQGRYFHTCTSRRYHEARHGLPCEY